MKNLTFRFLFASILTTVLSVQVSQAGIGDFLDNRELPKKVRDEIADLDISFSADLGDFDLANGINISTKYRYEVESSYLDQYYTRIDKWDLKTGVNVGDMIDNIADTPFSFSIERKNSFFFVRQFKDKKEAVKSLPYTPKKLPISAELALKNLNVGDFVSMPATLNVAVSAGASTSRAAPVVLDVGANVYWVVSGEFIVQVFKVDETHVRLKLMSRRGYSRGTSTEAGLSFKFFGVKILDRQIDRLVERDLVELGYGINPGSQFIVDYVFDLKNAEAKDAYNQILKSTLKFKDVVAVNKFDGEDLKEKLISSYEKADKLFETDKALDPKNRRVSRIFKGFNDYKANTKHLKLALLVTSFKKDNTYTENKVTYVDKNENNLEFLYPTYSKYMQTKTGKWFLDLKDQSFQNNFGLIPRLNSENTKNKNPDFGLTFERKDKYFSASEQKLIQKFMIGQIPAQFSEKLDIPEWKDGEKKKDSRIYFQLVLKAQGFNYLKNFSEEELTKLLIAYTVQKKKEHVLDSADSAWSKLKDFLFINRFIKQERLEGLASDLYKILKNKEKDSEIMTRKLVKLNEHGIFNKIGVGFLISLLPQDKLEELIYFKIEMTGKGLGAVNFEYGKLNYRALYNELAQAQARISGREYDLRVTDEDHQMENSDVGVEKNAQDTVLEDILSLN
jgi:hypothetical protein